MLLPYYAQGCSINTLPKRCYYVPFEDGQKRGFRTKSKRFVDLDGKWTIQAYDTVLDVGDFWTKTPTKRIDVPSCVQYYGLDYFQYTNVAYPFPYDPPYILKPNPAYHYSRNVTISSVDEFVSMVFEGVDSCFYLYVNGKFVGYSNVSHRISEFDVTNFVHVGDNKIDVLVLKWNMCSYLEDQDKWRFTGIFRSVYMLMRPSEHITDYTINTDFCGTDGKILFTNNSDVEILLDFYGRSFVAKPRQTVSILVPDVKLWSAETPNLYDLTLSANGEKIFERVGVRTSEVKDGIFLVNGKPVKLYGVNRHDFHPDKGAAVSYEDMRKDILLMKSLNVNALRTSHYPSSPLLYEMCDEQGLYVMSESDMESHGTVMMADGYDDSVFGALMDDPDFAHQIMERQLCNIVVNKNHACVVIWSLGNESGWGKYLAEALVAAKKLDNRPFHYESLWYCNRSDDTYYTTPVDMVSRMYPTVEWMSEEYLSDVKEHRPLVLCEYAHAMGNGPGEMREYWQLMESNDRFIGGFVWEWADHGVRYGKRGLCYGGDFGERRHDDNFCCDGIVSADREVKSGTLQMQHYYSPVTAELSGDVLTVYNKRFFLAANGKLEIECDGKTTIVDIALQPRESQTITVQGEDIAVRYYEGNRLVYQSQLRSKPQNPPVRKSVDTQIIDGDRYITAQNSCMTVVFDKCSGQVCSVVVDGEKYGALEATIYRAPIDNDRNVQGKFNDFYIDSAASQAKSYHIVGQTVEFDVSVAYCTKKPVVAMHLVYSFVEGAVQLAVEYRFDDCGTLPFLPRLGWTTKLPLEFDKLIYRAYGPTETYCDMYEFAQKKQYVSTISQQYHHYVKPQESGSHYLPDYAEVSDGKHFVRVEGMTSFSALPYSAKQIAGAKHDFELPKRDGTYLTADLFMSGLGSNACGPLPHECHLTPKNGSATLTFVYGKVEC